MFYLTLPSNSSVNHYPDNNASHYYTNLGGDFEVGLSEIQFSNSYYNVEKGVLDPVPSYRNNGAAPY